MNNNQTDCDTMNTIATPTSQHKMETPAMRRRREAREKKKADKLNAKIEAGKKLEAQIKAAAIIKPEDWKRIERRIFEIRQHAGRLCFSFFVRVVTEKNKKTIREWEVSRGEKLAEVMTPEYKTPENISKKYFRIGRIITFEAIFLLPGCDTTADIIETAKNMFAALFDGLIDTVKHRSDYPVFGSVITAEIKPAELSQLARP